ncbi:MAG: phospholipid/cholesterol/gamma-HCH transport system permease protein, partial [Myxococcota bacterium]
MPAVKFIERIGQMVLDKIEGIGDATLLAWEGVVWMFRRPFRWRLYLQSLEYIGVGSLVIVLLTGAFTGMVMAVQSAYAFRMFNAEGFVGSTVALALTRELAPVLTGLMVTGRVGSSIATEIGTMGVTEQIDALRTMAVNPVQYLVSPRITAAVITMPILCLLFSIIGVFGAYLVAVVGLGLDEGIFYARLIDVLTPWDVWSGLIKAAAFGFVIATVSCHAGYTAQGGARGVGLATTRAVVYSSVGVL